jgi:hypothetical protein
LPYPLVPRLVPQLVPRPAGPRVGCFPPALLTAPCAYSPV